MDNKNKLPAIQALRGIAALLVVCYHAQECLNLPELALGNILFGSGSMGVDLFFVISGFIMVYTTADSDGTLSYAKTFLWKRITRIVPTYFIATLTYIAIAKGINLFSEINLRTLIKSFLFLPLAPSQPAPFFGYAALPVGWTLNYEMIFYALFGISLLGGKLRWILLWALFGTALLAIPAANGRISLDPYTNYGFTQPYLPAMTNPILWQFMLGAITGRVFISGKPSVNRRLIQAVFITAVVIFTVHYLAPWKNGHGILRWGFSCGILVMATMMYTGNKPLNLPGWLIGLGNISFSLYLWHFAVSQFLPPLLKKYGLTPVNGPAMFFLYLTVSIILARASFELLEQRLSGFIRKKLAVG